MKSLVIWFCLILAFCGCAPSASTTSQAPAPIIPPECADSVLWKSHFMDNGNGPMIARVTISTALASAAVAGHPEVKQLVASTMPILYRATNGGNLAAALEEVKTKLKLGKAGEFATPILVLFDSLAQAGVINGGTVGLTACDKNILASLFKNIGTDAGALPEQF